MILKNLASADLSGKRLDEGAAQLFPILSKNRIRKIIDLGGCSVNSAMVRVASRQLREGDEIILGVMEPERFQDLVFKQDDILYEDNDVLAICKPAGINSQRTPYQLKGTVEYAIGTYLKSEGIEEPVRIVHRLDRGTSGLMLFPKNRASAARLSSQLHDGEIEKRYLALVKGMPPQCEWLVNAPIAKIAPSRYGVATPGKEAQTEFRVVAAGADAALLEARPLTGRTHQIRVHLEYDALPIVGDRVYGGAKACRMMLHCLSMSFLNRNGNRVPVSAPPDSVFLAVCKEFGIDAETEVFRMNTI
ncbi:MAG: RluA family pseudouridine synthase [Geobacteraceae bacterium]|nr:RluA family pseudouridine synthase [Geobacteraceae bacterium]